jgi:hypothetical protein
MRILEDTMLNNFYTLTAYFFTLICAKLNIEVNALDVHSQVITFFMSESAFKEMLARLRLTPIYVKMSVWKYHHAVFGKSFIFTLKHA